MSNVTRLMARRLGTVGLALALSLGSVGLFGCGGSSGDAAPEATESDAAEETEEVEEEAVEEKAAEEESEAFKPTQWFETSINESWSYDNESWENPGTTYRSENDTERTYEIDDKGNITKSTEVRTYESEYYQSVTETVEEYTVDENGWPLSIDVTETTREYSDELEEGVDSLEDAEPEVETSTMAFTYEYDDEGRVVKGVCDDKTKGTVELSYHDNGKPASLKQTYSYDQYGGTDEEDETVTYSFGVTFDEEGNQTSYSDSTEDSEGKTETVTKLDGEGNRLSETTTVTDADGTKHKMKKTYENEKNKDGKVVKSVCTVSGDGACTKERYVSTGTRVLESFGEDGSISVSEVTYDEDYNEVVGDPTSYDGPYSTEKSTYDKNGNTLTYEVTYYDGSTDKYTYTPDKDGNPTKSVHEALDGTVTTSESTYDKDGNWLTSTRTTVGGDNAETSTTMEWVFVEKPSEYAGIYRGYFFW